MSELIYKNNELENEVSLDMSYFWYSGVYRLALLQCSLKLNLIYFYDVWMLFKRLIFEFGRAFEQYLSPNADIVACSKLEAAIVKCIGGVEPLTNDKKEQLKCFKVETLNFKQNEIEDLN
jgi:hypothetical protein